MSLLRSKKAPLPAEKNEARLLAAAVRCFEKYGIEKTFIEDIAKEAGLSRPTAYRAFKNRRDLLERVAQERISGMEIRMRLRMLRYGSFEEALVRGAASSMRESRQDKIFMAVLTALGDDGLERYLLHPKSPVKANIGNIWGDTIDKAKLSGELKQGLSKADVVNWIIAVECILLLKNELSTKGQEEFLRKFMVPALIADSHRL